ncbi:hypothetical protein F5Y04DRAFT_256814 [Hypomontagnella monticulosa]|nr:hypothetical protein F5Y04DRAFT_256814 [Hypomontagnella monticulosa]
MWNLNLFAAACSLFLYTAKAQTTKINITAIGTHSGSSTIECWQLADSFSMIPNPNLFDLPAGTLGDVANISYFFAPAGGDIGTHNAPFKQWIFVLSGLMRVTVPDDSTAFYASGGKSGILFASDTPEVSTKGHLTSFPGTEGTLVATIPTKNNQNPAHTVLHSGPCKKAENFGLSDLTKPTTLKSRVAGRISNFL